MASATDDWKTGDYLVHFEKAAEKSAEEKFRKAFSSLAGELSLLDAEFLAEGMGCSKNLDDLLETFHSIYGRIGYCEKPRGFERECDTLYKDVALAVELVQRFRKSCTI